MRHIDEQAVTRYRIPSVLLMENAGLACTAKILKLRGIKINRVTVFSGKGNNGGDGFVVARHLLNARKSVTVFSFQNPSEMKSDPLLNFLILKKMKARVIDCSNRVSWFRIEKCLEMSDVVVDALFGTGLSKNIGGSYKTLIDLINRCGKRTVSVDIPSGLNADTGEIMGVCVKADLTVTFGLPKKGFLSRESQKYLGRVVVAGISLPRQLLYARRPYRRRR